MDAQFWDERYSGADLVWSPTANVFVAEVFSGMPPGRVLDAAAGEGRNAFWLVEQGWDVVATDFSPVAVERMRALAKERLDGASRGRFRAEVADATVLAPGDEGAFDAVLLCYLHLPAPMWRAAVEAASAALRPGGTLVVVQHALRNLADGVGGPQDPALLHDPDAMADSFAGLPLRLDRCAWVTRAVGDATAYDTLAVARKAP